MATKTYADIIEKCRVIRFSQDLAMAKGPSRRSKISREHADFPGKTIRTIKPSLAWFVAFKLVFISILLCLKTARVSSRVDPRKADDVVDDCVGFCIIK